MEVGMRSKLLLAVMCAAGSLLLILARASVAQGPALDTAAIEQATGLKGTMIADENVFKVSKPRSDVKVQVDQWAMPPFMGLGSWAAFTPAHGGVMIMGDTVVLEDEVNPAMSAALDAGLEVTALHNHFSTLRVEFVGTRFKVVFNGKSLFEVEDATIADAGMIGLWTKADSVTVFDGLTYGEKE
jgi:uncharacterized protein DUF1259